MKKRYFKLNCDGVDMHSISEQSASWNSKSLSIEVILDVPQWVPARAKYRKLNGVANIKEAASSSIKLREGIINWWKQRVGRAGCPKGVTFPTTVLGTLWTGNIVFDIAQIPVFIPIPIFLKIPVPCFYGTSLPETIFYRTNEHGVEIDSTDYLRF